MRDDILHREGDDDILARVEALSEQMTLARAELDESREHGRLLLEALRKVGTQLCMLGVLPI